MIGSADMSTTTADTLNTTDVRELVESIIISLDALLETKNIMKVLLVIVDHPEYFESAGGTVSPDRLAAESMRSYLNWSPSDSCEIWVLICQLRRDVNCLFNVSGMSVSAVMELLHKRTNFTLWLFMTGMDKMFQHSLETTSCLNSTVGHAEVLQATPTTVPFEHFADTWEVASDDAAVHTVPDETSTDDASDAIDPWWASHTIAM